MEVTIRAKAVKYAEKKIKIMPPRRRISDKERLDWLGSIKASTVHFTVQIGKSGIYIWELAEKEYPSGFFRKNIRTLIDAAIRAERKKC